MSGDKFNMIRRQWPPDLKNSDFQMWQFLYKEFCMDDNREMSPDDLVTFVRNVYDKTVYIVKQHDWH